MYKVIQNNLYLTRGDTAVFPLKVTYMDDTEYTFEEGDKVLFTVRKRQQTAKHFSRKKSPTGCCFSCLKTRRPFHTEDTAMTCSLRSNTGQ